MTYKQIYGVLNKAGAIDRVIASEVSNGRDLQMVKVDIIDVINYLVDFPKSPSFKNMTYWYDHLKLTESQKGHARVYEALVPVYCDCMIAKCTKQVEEYTYYKNTIVRA